MRLTMALLYQLSYIGKFKFYKCKILLHQQYSGAKREYQIIN
jgi:hypothetical protein